MTPRPPGEAPPEPAPHLRAAGQATRDAVARAARELFAAHGFNDTSVRAIGAAAGVDPALVIRHFGSKEALFLQTVDHEWGVREVIDGPLETLGRRLVTYYLSKANTRTRQTYAALTQASHRPQVRKEINRLNQRRFLTPLAERLGGPQRDLRAALAWAQISGLLHTLMLDEDDVLPGDVDDIVALYGDTLQHLLTPEG
jgi:AcrR family transcriptional regulator